jgi:hypothetical protein
MAATSTYVPTFPNHVEDLQFLSGPSIADVGGLPTPEVVAASAGYFIHAYDGTGLEPTGWPKFTGGWNISNPAIGDVDGDGLNEVVTLTREGNLFVWDTTAPAARRSGRRSVTTCGTRATTRSRRVRRPTPRARRRRA